VADVTIAVEEEIEEELRGATARILVWLAVAAGIGMAVVQVVRLVQQKFGSGENEDATD